jgi:hypothetical protein
MSGRALVSLIWDNEYPDRCFFVVGPKSRASMSLSLFAKETKAIREALVKLSRDLAQENK